MHGHTTLYAQRQGRSVIARSGYGRGKWPALVRDDTTEESYRLVAIEPSRAPEGCQGRDWFVYRISQGTNMITGYRQGDLRAATADVERIVVGLNERRISSKGRPGPKPKPTASTPAPAAAPPDTEDAAS